MEILRRFAASWDDTIDFYKELITSHKGGDHLVYLLDFIVQLRATGADHLFRLGTSVSSLIISRSVEHNLRHDQKHISIEAFDGEFHVVLKDGNSLYRDYWLSDLADIRVEKLMTTLKNTLVD